MRAACLGARLGSKPPALGFSVLWRTADFTPAPFAACVKPLLVQMDFIYVPLGSAPHHAKENLQTAELQRLPS